MLDFRTDKIYMFIIYIFYYLYYYVIDWSVIVKKKVG